jgi:Bacteriophage lambda head decoration protein D
MPPLQEPPKALDFVFSEANGYRSREKVIIDGSATALPLPATRIPLVPGTFLYPQFAAGVPTGKYLPVSVPGTGTPPDPANPGSGSEVFRVNSVLLYPVDARAGDVEVAVIRRDAELNDAYLIWALANTAGTPFTPAEENAIRAALLLNGIIIRQGVLAESLANPPIEPPAIAPVP